MADFGPVPKEAIAFIKNKGMKVSNSWLDVWAEEHAYSFTVAKAMQLDVLETIKTEIEKALENGTTLAAFQKELEPMLVRLGWWGRQEVVDTETGEVANAQLGSPRRLKTIYNANMRSARAAGQWQRAQRTKRALPFLVYGLGPSRVHREEHAALAGLVLPVDDPFWNTHMPPNGWECKCTVRQASLADVQRRGLQVGTAPQIEMRQFTNRRTGEVVWVPKGIDPGWATNPGKTRRASLEQALEGKLKTADPAISATVKRDLASEGIHIG